MLNVYQSVNFVDNSLGAGTSVKNPFEASSGTAVQGFECRPVSAELRLIPTQAMSTATGTITLVQVTEGTPDYSWTNIRARPGAEVYGVLNECSKVWIPADPSDLMFLKPVSSKTGPLL